MLNNRIAKNHVWWRAHEAFMSMLVGLSLPMHAQESSMSMLVMLSRARPFLDKLTPGCPKEDISPVKTTYLRNYAHALRFGD